MRPLCIYHGNCDDGFGAAWAVRLALGDGVEFYAGAYGAPPPDVTGREVLLVDFSYKRAVLEQIIAAADTLTVLDHHKTAQEDLAGLNNIRPGVKVIFDMARSGAGLAWDYFHPDTSRPQFIDYIEDRDLWRKQLPGVDEFTIALRSYPQDFAVWNQLSGQVQELIREGRSLQRYFRLRVEELKRASYLAVIGGHKCAVANAPYFASSEVAGELCATEGAEFGATFYEAAPGRISYSLRSRGDFDVSAVAKQFGGGGHKNAAGFASDGPSHVAA